MIKNKVLVEIAKKYPKELTQTYRIATCAGCGRNVYKMWHCWFKGGGFHKEIHLCPRCYKFYGLQK